MKSYKRGDDNTENIVMQVKSESSDLDITSFGQCSFNE